MHTLKYTVLDVSGVDGGFTVERLRHELDRRLHLLPPFRRRLVEVPLGAAPPGVDRGSRLRPRRPRPPRRRARARRPRARWTSVIGEIASWQLDRRRPLWECWVLDGLADDLDDPPPARRRAPRRLPREDAPRHGRRRRRRRAARQRDGDGAPTPSTRRRRSSRGGRSRCRRAWRLLVDAVRRRRCANLRGLPGAAAPHGRRRAGGGSADRKAAERLAAACRSCDTGRTPFNGALTPHRSFATADLSPRRRQGGAGRLRRHGQRRRARHRRRRRCARTCSPARRPARPSRSSPACRWRPTPPSDVRRLSGNRVSNLFTSLRTDIDDPVERLRAIHEVTGAAKEVQNLLGTDMLADWSEYAPPRPYAWFMRQYSRLGLADRAPPADQPRRVERARPPRAALHRRRPPGGHLVGRSDPRGHRAQRDGVELPATRCTSACIGCREHWADLARRHRRHGRRARRAAGARREADMRVRS